MIFFLFSDDRGFSHVGLNWWGGVLSVGNVYYIQSLPVRLKYFHSLSERLNTAFITVALFFLPIGLPRFAGWFVVLNLVALPNSTMFLFAIGIVVK